MRLGATARLGGDWRKTRGEFRDRDNKVLSQSPNAALRDARPSRQGALVTLQPLDAVCNGRFAGKPVTKPTVRPRFVNTDTLSESARGNPGGPLYGGAAGVKILLARSGNTLGVHLEARVER